MVTFADLHLGDNLDLLTLYDAGNREGILLKQLTAESDIGLILKLCLLFL